MAWVLFLNAITLLLLNLQLHYLPYHTPQVENQAAASGVTYEGEVGFGLIVGTPGEVLTLLHTNNSVGKQSG